MRALHIAALAPEPAEEAVTAPEPVSLPRPLEHAAVGNLRAFVTLMVLAHHAVLAYHPFAPALTASLSAQPHMWAAFPVVDSSKWSGWGLLVGFNDLFFMALMFLLSGLFVWQSLESRGSGGFLRQRALRLGLPFVVAAAVIAPLAYVPAHLQRGGDLAGFWQQWSSLGNWPAGPAWFLWVLLAFDAVAAGLYLLWPRWGAALGRATEGAQRRPVVFFTLLATASAAVYIPLALAFNPFRWTEFGPFFFQTSRILHYAVYFLAGIALGASGLGKGLLAPEGKLARRWPLWQVASFVLFTVIIAIMIIVSAPGKVVPLSLEITGDTVFSLSCAASSFALLAFFLRFARTSGPIWASLRRNAFGMYLVHYAFVSWLQYALLPAQMSGFTKGAVAFLGTVALSWGTTALLRRIPGVARVL